MAISDVRVQHELAGFENRWRSRFLRVRCLHRLPQRESTGPGEFLDQKPSV